MIAALPTMQLAQTTASQAASQASPAAAAKQRKLTVAAQQFEAMFLQQMMKPFSEKSEDGSDSEDGNSDPGGSSTYQSLGVQSMAQAISAAGGFGIARSIVASVEKQASENLNDEKK